MTLRVLFTMIAVCGGLSAAAAHAQTLGAEVAVEAATDRRVRGLSWSDGKPALAISATVPATFDLTVDIAAATLRGSARHGGADAGVTLAPRYAMTSGGWTVGVGARGSMFIGASGMSFFEVTGDVERTVGPGRLIASIDFAPSQSAIGGSNIHLAADVLIGVPSTSLTLYGGAGYSSGSIRNAERAQRLRPGGNYMDYRIGIERTGGRLALGLLYSGTTIHASDAGSPPRYTDRHLGHAALAYLRFTP